MNCSTDFLRNVILSAAVLPVFPIIADSAPKSKPNIIVIYIDDHGWADLGVRGVNSDIRKPNLDKLAADGVRFSHGYVSAPQCVPSRAGLITGRYQQRFDMGTNGSRSFSLEELTIAESLKEAGNVSCHVGKWHLDNPEGKNKRGNDRTETGSKYSSLPADLGFVEYYNGQLNTINASHDIQGNKLSDGKTFLKFVSKREHAMNGIGNL